MPADNWAGRVFAWFDQHGRHDLPWQHPRSPYRVWVSEIMLQQTTVSAVIPYFQAFMQRLPDVHALAACDNDELMSLWSGLGYYARARNLHRAAKILVEDYAGEFPHEVETLQSLPGIGRSTAGAIAAQAFGQRAAILDGNVKRVLARHAAIQGWPGQSAVLKQLWSEAEARLPDQRQAEYAQAMMDLGATVCVRRKPRCEVCPVDADCGARAQGLTATIPAPKPRKERPVREEKFLIVRDDCGRVLLQRRPPSGIWGGLWSLPEFTAHGHGVTRLESLGPALRHEFSHFSLWLEPVGAQLATNRLAEDDDLDWHTVEQALALGLPQPVRRLIETYCA